LFFASRSVSNHVFWYTRADLAPALFESNEKRPTRLPALPQNFRVADNPLEISILRRQTVDK